jgi:hypothetical protein
VTPIIDVEVSNGGTIWTFTPVTDAARAFFEAHVHTEPWQWMGPSLCVDHRMVGFLLDCIQSEGLVTA